MSTSTTHHHPIMAPMVLKKAAGILHSFINDRFNRGQMSGEDAERLSLLVTKLLMSITWPSCNCTGCNAEDGYGWN